MGSFCVAQQTVEDGLVLQFQQSEEALARNGGLVYRFPDGQEIAQEHIYFKDKRIAALRESTFTSSEE